MKLPWHFLTKGDVLVVLCMLCLGLVSLVWTMTAAPGRQLVVSDGAQTLFTATLDQSRDIALEGPLGTTQLVVDQQGARITHSPCRLKVCMRMGPARRAGDILACVPNRILVQVVGAEPEESRYDLLSR